MRGFMAAGQAEMAADEVSMEKLFDDVAKELTALVVLFPSATIAGWFAGEWSREEVARRLSRLLGGAWKERYRKAINKKPRPKVKKAKCSGAHTSVQKLLEAKRQEATRIQGWTVGEVVQIGGASLPASRSPASRLGRSLALPESRKAI